MRAAQHEIVDFDLAIDQELARIEPKRPASELGEPRIGGANGFHSMDAIDDGAPPPNGIEDYDLPAGGINEPELVPAAPLISPPSWPRKRRLTWHGPRTTSFPVVTFQAWAAMVVRVRPCWRYSLQSR